MEVTFAAAAANLTDFNIENGANVAGAKDMIFTAAAAKFTDFYMHRNAFINSYLYKLSDKAD